jgi:hypothetical protein
MCTPAGCGESSHLFQGAIFAWLVNPVVRVKNTRVPLANFHSRLRRAENGHFKMDLKNSWIFPVVQSIHLGGIALLVGSIVIVNLRSLGYVLSRYGESEVSRRFRGWSLAGFAVIFLTGPILFLADVTRYVHNPAFLVKMAVLGAALFFHSIFQSRAKAAAIISILLWAGVLLAGRAIADFDI